MKIYSNHNSTTQDPINFFGFEKLANQGFGAENLEFYYGGHANNKVFEASSNKKVFFSTEEQCWSRDTTDNFVDHVDKILTICPPEITGRKKREYCFFPFPEEFVPTNFNKDIDLIFTGTAGAQHSDDIISVIKNYNYCFASFLYRPEVTHFNVSYQEKINLIARSKIYPLHNKVGDGNPQIKSRPFESAFCKSLILCLKDEWNIIEKWFEPNKEFLYYNNKEHLNDVIKEVLENYDQYLPVIDAAHNKAVNSYTTRHFVQKYLS